ncbi:MAG: prolipoprotein diacylglyceryl transferase [Chlamydiae bacterium]|nr:prolipoprotein diacylglyceryl transferase [Chlamydiota bacterium]
MFAYFYWDPNRFMFDVNIPILDRPILWYGFLFALGFFIGYFICRRLLVWYLLAKPYITLDDILSFKIVSQVIEQYKQEGSSCFKSLTTKDLSSPDQFIKGMQRIVSTEKKLPFNKRSFLLTYLQKFLLENEKRILSIRLHFEDVLGSSILTISQKAAVITESISFASILGAVIGSRLGDVIFYQDFSFYIHNPISIIQIWKGGLSSHGGAAGVFIALWILSRKKKFKDIGLSLLRIADLVTIPTALIATFIRIGNFINQEILGTTTTVPWAVIFGHPADGTAPTPRHPVQLYEAVIYFFIFLTLAVNWKRLFRLVKPGFVLGLFLIAVFLSRFILEFFKTEQSDYLLLQTHLHMGQYLSIPFILAGIYLVFRRKNNDL